MRLAILILCVSAAVLGYEIALMRALSVARWHHFAYMIVSIALLGFGASGTLLALLRERLLERFDRALSAFAAAFALSIPVSFALAQRVPFDAFQLAWDWRQCLYLSLYYLILFVPFMLGATCIGLALVREAHQAHRIYFWNLLGSGIGACGIVPLMYLLPPASLPFGAFLAACLGLLIYGADRRARVAIAVPTIVAALLLLWAAGLGSDLNISEHKQLTLLLDLPDTRVVDARTGPLGTIHVLDGPAIRLVAGRSVAYQGPEPVQRAIVVDADSASAVNHITAPEQAEGFDYTPNALPYYLLDRPRTLIIGAGGGSDVVLARRHRCPSTTALELNPQIVDLMRGSQAEFAQRLYNQPGVELIAAEARGFLARSQARYDLIQLPLVESLGATSAGVAALNESYLYTVEAMELYLDRLEPHGILSITRWLRTPPSDVVRILNTLADALGRRVRGGPGRHAIAIRGMFTATVLASPAPFSPQQLEAARAFCRERSFDLVWLPERRPYRTNHYNKLPMPYYALAAESIFQSAERRRELVRRYPYDITPTTDDRPYHALTFRWRALRHLRETMGDQWVRYVDWGYLVLVATLAQAVVAGVVLILVPLLFLRRRAGARGGRVATCVYFACLGVAYMCIEIVMMQKLALFLASPIYAAAVVLGSFMLFSGLGSLVAGRLLDRERRAATLGILAILVVGFAMQFGLDPLLRGLAGSATWLRMPVAAACAGALAFFMGMPFPSGLRRVASRVPALTPWAWGVNGCASVVGATLAMVLAVSFGFRAVLLLAFALYALAGLALRGITARA